jgi:dimethylaniline monooxygenase (N-oxide forming)
MNCYSGDEKETPCDAVVLATGYKVSFPFISQDLIPTDKNQVQLYKYVFSPKLKHPKTLAFISLIQPIGAILPIGEMQSRWFALLMANKLKLPNVKAMNEDIEKKRCEAMMRYYESERHTIQVDWIPFMDELGAIVGVKPNLFKYFFTDHELWRALYFGYCVPYQYRLEGISYFLFSFDTFSASNICSFLRSTFLVRCKRGYSHSKG